MTAFDACRNDGDPGLVRVHERPNLRVIPGGAGWRRAVSTLGPLLPLAFGAGLIVGSWAAMLVRVRG